MEQDVEVTVDGVTYAFKDLSGEAQAQVTSLKFVDAELVALKAKIAVYTTARNSYESALRQLLPRSIQ